MALEMGGGAPPKESQSGGTQTPDRNKSGGTAATRPGGGERNRPGGSRPGENRPGANRPRGSRPGGRTSENRHQVGFDRGPGRGREPKEAPAAPHGEKESLRREHDISSELVKRVKDSLKDDLERLVEIRKKRTPEAFEQFLRDSGHSYYSEIFAKLTTEKPGTAHRARELNEDAIDAFFSSDAGRTRAYEIAHIKLIDTSMAAAVTMSVSPDIPTQKGLKNETITRREGGILRKPARSIKKWWGTPIGLTEGRGEAGVDVRGLRHWTQTRGRFTVAVIGTGGIAGVVGGIVYASRRGETLDLNVSPDAVRGYLGDPNSPTASRPNEAQRAWSKEFNKVDPGDFRIDAQGNVVRTEGVGGTSVDDKTLRDELAGLADLVLDFQKENGIRPELRQVGLNWVFDGTGNRTRHGTPSEEWIERFDPDRKGIRDMNGNARERSTVPGIYLPATTNVETRVLDRLGNVIMEGGTPRMIQATNPDGTLAKNADGTPRLVQERDLAGNIVMDGATPVSETRQVIIMEQARDTAGRILYDTNNNPIMIPRMEFVENPRGRRLLLDIYNRPRAVPMMTQITNGAGDVLDVPIMEPLIDEYGHTVMDRIGNAVIVPRMRDVTEADIVQRPLTNPDGTPRWEMNPNFDPTNLDVAGNITRAREAIDTTLREGVHEVFQDLEDGETNKQQELFDKIAAKREARSKMTTEVVEGQKKVLEADQTTLSEEAELLKDFLKKTTERDKKIVKAKEKQDSILGIVTDARGNAMPVSRAQQALNNVSESGSREVIAINGERISSIPDAYTAIEKDIEDRVDRSPQAKRARDAEIRATDANNILATARVTHEHSQQELVEATTIFVEAQQLFGNAGGQAELQRLQVNVSNARQEQDARTRNENFLAAEIQALPAGTSAAERAAIQQQLEQASRLVANATEHAEETTRQLQDIQRLQDAILTAQRNQDAAKRAEATARSAVDRNQLLVEKAEQRDNEAQDQLTLYEARVRDSQEMVNKRAKVEKQEALIADILKQYADEGISITALENNAIEGEDDVETLADSFITAQTTINNWNRLADTTVTPNITAIDLTDDALRTESFDELMSRINQAGGWPANRNSDPENRLTLLHAMIEARADDLYMNVSSYSTRELARQKAMKDVIHDIGQRVKIAEKTEERVKKGDHSTPELDAIERGAQRYDIVIETFMDKLSTEEDLDRFFGIVRDPTNPDPAKQVSYLQANDPRFYSPAQRQLSVAAANIMDAFFGDRSDNETHYEGQTGPDAALLRNLALLAPGETDIPAAVEKQIKDALRDRFDITGITATDNLGRTIDKLRTQLGISFRPIFAAFLAEDYHLQNLLKMVDRY